MERDTVETEQLVKSFKYISFFLFEFSLSAFYLFL